MEKQQGTQAPEHTQAGHRLSSDEQFISQGMKREKISSMQRSPLRFFIIMIAAIFMAEVVAMIVVYFIEPLPYHLTTLIDAGIMTVLIFPVLYYFSFRPLLLHIEKSRQTEGSLLQARQLQERFFNSIDTLIAYMDRDFNFIRVNNAYAKEDGHTPEYFIGRNHFGLYPHPENQAIFQRVVETGEAFWVYERPFEYPDHPEWGVMYWDWRLQPVMGTDGSVEGLVLSLLNVTERKRAHDVIRQFSRIVEQTEDTVVVTNCEGVIEYVNPAFERLTGYTKEEAVGKTPRIIKSGSYDEKFYQDLWHTIRKGNVFQSEMANRKKNGELFYEVKTIAPLRDAQGEITHYVATGKDITTHKQDEEALRKAYEDLEARVEKRTEELRIANHDLEAEINIRRQTEEALRRSESGLMRAQGMAHLGNWELDLIHNQLTWSDEVYRIFGLQPQEFRASYEAFLETVHPDDRAMVDNAYSRSVTEGKDGYEIEHRIVKRSSGEIRILYEKCEHFRDETGQIIRSIGMVHDITERRKAEEQLRYQAALLSNVNDAIVASDARFRITAWNSAAEALYGWKAEEVIGRDGLEIVRTEWSDRDASQMRQAIAEAGRWRGEATQMRKDGTRFPVEVSSMALRDTSGQVTDYISVNRDITERRQAEEALRRSEALLLQTGQMARVGGWELELESMSGYWSLETYRIHEVDPSVQPDLEGAMNFYTPEARSIIQEAVQRAIEEGTSYDLELPIVTAKGNSRWIRTIGESEFRDGKCVRLFGTFQDITERKQAERRLAYLASFPERNPNPVIEVDFEGHVHYMSPAALNILPDLAERGLPHPWLAGLDRLVRAFHESQVASTTYDVVLGEHFYQQSLYVLAEERLVRIYATEITKRRQAEQALRYAHDELELRVQERTEELAIANKELVKEIAERVVIERQLRLQAAAMEAAANGIVITDCEGTIQWTNPSLFQISGYETRELIGHNMKIFRSGQQDEMYYRQMWKTILSGRVWQGEITNRRKDGSYYIEEQTITPVRGDHGEITQFIAIKQDITERKKAEKDIRERNQKEKILTQTIHTMQLDIARDLHDTIGQNISFLRMKLDHLAEKPTRKRAEMQAEIRSMAEVANESYDLMRGTLAVLQSENSTDLFRLFTRYAQQIEERSEFKIDLSTQGEPRFVSAKRMRQLFYVFREILNNIEKHANASEVSIKMSWDRDYLNLVVHDNGSGFELDKVQYGNHYGLKFMRERVELLNGSLLIRSAEGSGTNIVLQIPYE